MSRSKTSYLVDVNIWLALVYDYHAHHELVLHWFETLPNQTALCCRIVQLALFRLLTNPSVMQSRVKAKSEAWRIWDQLLSDERVMFLAEPDDLEAEMRRLTKTQPAGHKQWMDAYLAAFAICSHLEIATVDQGFRAYRGVPSTILGSVQ